MYKYQIKRDAFGQIICIETNLSGHNLLNKPTLNKGCAFTQEEREEFNLIGLLPYQVETLEQQVARMYEQYHEHHSHLGKNIYLNVLHDYNETLFYKLVSQHLEEMLPIVYTPTVGEAVQHFSLEHRKTKGLYIAYPDRDKIEEILENRLPAEVDLSVVTDGEAVLGIGDQGIGGINISIAKLMVYTLGAGINPHRVLPIQLDVGTNNTHLLNDPMYLGWRHERIAGQAYDDFIDAFVNILMKKFPHLLLHWEDFGRDNARRILNRYRKNICTLNGDIQATGVIALACVLAGMAVSGIPLIDHRIVILGGGTAGVGIADQICDAMQRAGQSEKKARAPIWIVDKQGLLTDQSKLLPFQEKYARSSEEIKTWASQNPSTINFLDVVKHVEPTILIGSSTATGAFTEEIVKLMAAKTPRPIIMPLSNPTNLSEATPENLIRWTDAKAIIATGSPFPDVNFNGKWHRIAQSNNAFAFPGIGLGAIVAKAKLITDEMLWVATQALSKCAPINQDKFSPLLPKLSEVKMVSAEVALAVAEEARRSGLSQVAADVDFKQAIKALMWEPTYYPYRKK